MIHFNLLFCYFVKRGKKALSLKWTLGRLSPRALVVEKTPQRPLSARGCIKLGPEKRTPSRDYLKIRKKGTEAPNIPCGNLKLQCCTQCNAMQWKCSVLSYNLCLFVSINSGSIFFTFEFRANLGSWLSSWASSFSSGSSGNFNWPRWEFRPKSLSSGDPANANQQVCRLLILPKILFLQALIIWVGPFWTWADWCANQAGETE